MGDSDDSIRKELQVSDYLYPYLCGLAYFCLVIPNASNEWTDTHTPVNRSDPTRNRSVKIGEVQNRHLNVCCPIKLTLTWVLRVGAVAETSWDELLANVRLHPSKRVVWASFMYARIEGVDCQPEGARSRARSHFASYLTR